MHLVSFRNIPGLGWFPSGWWFRNPAFTGWGCLFIHVYPCLSQYFQSFIHPKGGFLARDFWTINSIKSHFCLWNTQKCFQCKPANLFEDWWKPEILLSFQPKNSTTVGHPVFFRQPLPWSPNPPPKKIIRIPTTFWGHLRWIIMQILMVFHKSHCQRWVTKSTKNPKVFHSEFRLPLKNGWERKEDWSGFHFWGLEVPFQGGFAVLNFGRVSNFFSCFLLEDKCGGAARFWIFKVDWYSRSSPRCLSNAWSVAMWVLGVYMSKRQLWNDHWIIKLTWVWLRCLKHGLAFHVLFKK